MHHQDKPHRTPHHPAAAIRFYPPNTDTAPACKTCHAGPNEPCYPGCESRPR